MLALGTGQALAVTARGDADLLLVHDPEAEGKFMAAGHGVSRRLVAWNDFIIVGPRSDPAHVGGGHDAGGGAGGHRAGKGAVRSRAATTAGRMRWRSGCGARPGSTRTRSGRGTATSAAAWGRR